MTDASVWQNIQASFDEVFLDEVKVGPALSAKDVPEWDSLTHIALVASIEKRFGIRFRTGEVEGTKNVGELAELIGRRLTEK